ncbi:MAG: hypothetical protein JST79_16245 [Acidobacteria bacterium]|nr:hypothetical protein [Acidobacteriota bacterium]
MKLTTKPKNPGAGFHVRLENAPRIAQADDGSEQKVADILTTDRRTSPFSFGFVAAFVIAPTHKYALQHASLAVFHEIAGEPVPLFRAEWDKLAASDEISKHAQPHWHFVQSPERIGGIVRTLMTPSGGTTNEFTPESPMELLFPGLVDCGKFHFAMTSLWEKSETPPYKKRTFDSSDFPKWFKSLTGYVAAQIAYLVSHIPPEATPVARAFVPAEAELQD